MGGNQIFQHTSMDKDCAWVLLHIILRVTCETMRAALFHLRHLINICFLVVL